MERAQAAQLGRGRGWDLKVESWSLFWWWWCRLDVRQPNGEKHIVPYWSCRTEPRMAVIDAVESFNSSGWVNMGVWFGSSCVWSDPS